MRAKKKYIETLERRLEYLRETVDSANQNKAHFVKAEIGALEWAIPLLKVQIKIGGHE